jgi:hypothetical protein
MRGRVCLVLSARAAALALRIQHTLSSTQCCVLTVSSLCTMSQPLPRPSDTCGFSSSKCLPSTLELTATPQNGLGGLRGRRAAATRGELFASPDDTRAAHGAQGQCDANSLALRRRVVVAREAHLLRERRLG